MNALQLAKEAFKLVENKSTWTQFSMAYTKDGVSVNATNPEACRWCSSGAIDKVAVDNNVTHLRNVVTEALNYESHKFNKHNIIEMNDYTTHDEVVAVWKKAIENLENNGE